MEIKIPSWLFYIVLWTTFIRFIVQPLVMDVYVYPNQCQKFFDCYNSHDNQKDEWECAKEINPKDQAGVIGACFKRLKGE